MIYSSPTLKTGIVEDIDFGVSSNSVSYPIEDKTRNVNKGLDRVADLIQKADGDWNWDSSNQTDLPIGVTDIKQGQYDYTIDTTFLSVKGIYLKDANSDLFTELKLIDRSFILTMDTNVTGIPYGYYVDGGTIYLDCPPQADISGGLKVHFQRNVDYFTVSDTTKTAGFNPQFHELLSLYAQENYAYAKSLPNLQSLVIKIQKLEKALQESYARRNKIKNTQMKVSLDVSNYM